MQTTDCEALFALQQPQLDSIGVNSQSQSQRLSLPYAASRLDSIPTTGGSGMHANPTTTTTTTTSGDPRLTSSNSNNVVFQWSSPPRNIPGTPTITFVDPMGDDSRIVQHQHPDGSMTTTTTTTTGAHPLGMRSTSSRPRHGSSHSTALLSPEKRRSICSLSLPNTSVQTTIQTSTTGSTLDKHVNPYCTGTMVPQASIRNQLTGQLESLDQLFRHGELDAHDYHHRVAELMVQAHSTGLSTAGHPVSSVALDPSYSGVPQGSNLVVFNSASPILLPGRLVSTNSGYGSVVGSTPLVPQGLTTVVLPSLGHSHLSSMLNPTLGTCPNILGTNLSGPAGGTTTTTTTTTRKRIPSQARSGTSSPSTTPEQYQLRDAVRPSNMLHHALSHHRNIVSNNYINRTSAIALSPSDLLLTLKLLEKHQGTVSDSQLTAVFYTFVSDAGHALDCQLKAELDSRFIAPEVRSILTSTSMASHAATELGSFANSLYKAAKRSRIQGLRTKQNRLRLLATEASTRKWRGKELLGFLVSVLQALDRDLSPAERITVIHALVTKLKRRAGSTGSLGELYRSLDVVFPGADKDAETRAALLSHHSKKAVLSLLTFSKDLCHGCDQKLMGIRFRCLHCHQDAVNKGRDQDTASPQRQTKSNGIEYLLCSDCFLAAYSNLDRTDNNSGMEENGSFDLTPSQQRQFTGPASLRHRDSNKLCPKQFLCEIPLTVLSLSSSMHRPLQHVIFAPQEGWRAISLAGTAGRDTESTTGVENFLNNTVQSRDDDSDAHQ